jgi:AAA domain
MRLAVVGTHCSGKTTLVEDFASMFPTYGHEGEPYYALLEQGVVFSDPPDFDDFISQAEYSIERVMHRSAERDVIFDRCPLDLLAYLDVLGRASGQSVPEALLGDAEEAVRTLDLVAFLPLSNPDEIGGSPDHPKLRVRVDRRLKQMLREDERRLFDGTGPALVELRGSETRRLETLSRATGL